MKKMEINNIVDLIKKEAEEDLDFTAKMPREDQIKKFTQFQAATETVQRILDTLHELDKDEFDKLLDHPAFEKIARTVHSFVELGLSVGFIGKLEQTEKDE